MSTTAAVPPPPGASRSPTLRAFLVFVVVFGALFSYEISALFFRQTGVPAVGRGDQPRAIGEIEGPTVVSQTFGIHAGGFSGVTIEAQPSHGPVAGDVVFTVTDIGAVGGPGETVEAAEPRQVARVEVPVPEVVASERFRIAFEPVEESQGRQYRLEIAAPTSPLGHGLSVWATRDQVYDDGVLTAFGREQPLDLVFMAHADRATLFRRIEHMLADKPGWLRSRWTLGLSIVLYNWALATFTWYMLFVEDEPGGTAAPS